VGTDAAFGVTLGDILFDDLSLFGSLNATVALIGIPWYNVLGNHDINFDAAHDAHSDETFESVYGPPYYSFDHGPVHFLVLDDVHWKGRVDEGYRGGNYTGGLGPDQLTFIERDLARVPDERLVVLMMHIPLVSSWVDPDREALYRLIEPRPHAMSISAHYHFHEHVFLTDEDGWRGPEPHHHVITVTTSGSWWRGASDETGIPHTTMRDGAPNGTALLSFDGHRYTLDFLAARRPADEQMHVIVPDEVHRRRAHLTEVLVNVYNGSERSTVETRVGGEGDWRPLEQVARPDPTYEAVREAEVAAEPEAWRPVPRAVDSPHLWRTLLPRGLSVGTRRIDVRTTDMWGRTFHASRALRVVD